MIAQKDEESFGEIIGLSKNPLKQGKQKEKRKKRKEKKKPEFFLLYPIVTIE